MRPALVPLLFVALAAALVAKSQALTCKAYFGTASEDDIASPETECSTDAQKNAVISAGTTCAGLPSSACSVAEPVCWFEDTCNG